MESTLPRIALTAGDPAGIGPEIVARALESPRVAERARLVVLGPEACRPRSVPRIEREALADLRSHAWLVTAGEGDWQCGLPQASAGRAALAALRAGHELALSGAADALV